jgi:hypothetical protein
MIDSWDSHYQKGGDSGPGSTGSVRDFKWEAISKYSDASDVIDVGCGDLQAWEGRDCKKYLGLDISPAIIERNKRVRPNWKFELITPGQRTLARADTVLCLEVLFHILDEETFVDTLESLCVYSTKWIFVYTWKENPFDKWSVREQAIRYLARRGHFSKALRMAVRHDTDGVFQKYRDFTKYLPIFTRAGFELLATELRYSPGAMYIFRKS